VAQRLEKELKRSGLRTVMTRTDDSFVGLGKRSMTANLQKDAVFVSIHFNVGSRLGARGFESFYRSSESAGLAHAMQRAMLETIPTENRGVKRRGFYVLRHTEIPAVLLECGFMSNADEARIIRTPEFRQKLAEKLAAALVQSARMGART
jgi:N-acetylmuramoyl-L-alanine amidase